MDQGGHHHGELWADFSESISYFLFVLKARPKILVDFFLATQGEFPSALALLIWHFLKGSYPVR